MLLFGQLLAEMYEANVIVFIGELRNIVETDCRMTILSQLDKSQNVNAIRIPYAKIKSVISKFVLRNSVDNSVELLMEQLKTRYPTVKRELPASHRIQHRLFRFFSLFRPSFCEKMPGSCHFWVRTHDRRVRKQLQKFQSQ